MPDNRNSDSRAPVVNYASIVENIAAIERIVDTLSPSISREQIQDMHGKIEQLRLKVKQFENERRNAHSEQIKELVEMIEELQRQILVLSQESFGRGTFVRFVRTERILNVDLSLIEIKDASGRYARVYCDPEKVDAKSLHYGQKVITQGVSGAGNVVEALNEETLCGAQATVVEVLSKDDEAHCVLLSLSETEERIVAHISGEVDVKDIEVGSRVLYDPTSSIVFCVLPKQESKKFLVTEIPTVTFDDIGGLEDVKKAIKEKLAWPLLFPQTYRDLGLPMPKGFILEGPPGNGKTMIAKAAVNFLSDLLRKELNQKVEGHFMHIAGPELLHWFVGRTEYMLREEVFGAAKKIASPTSPVLIFFDEADSFLRPRGRVVSSDVHETHVPQFNALMDGLEDMGFVIVILATNRRDLIDPAAIRPGRFDRTFVVTPPGEAGARAIFEIYLKPEHVHSKYLVPVYTPRDREGRPRRGANGKIIKHKFDSDPAKARQYLIDCAISRIYGKHPRNVFLRIRKERSEKPVDFYYGSFCSGARIKNIIDRAKEYAIRRFNEGERDHPARVSLIDILTAIEDVFAELRHPLVSREEIRNWLATEGQLEGIGDDVSFEFPGGNDTLDREAD